MLVGEKQRPSKRRKGQRGADEDAVTSSVPTASLQLLAVSDTTTTTTLVEECMRACVRA